MIASCPTCGTHYKHEAPVAPVRMRCGRCASSIDISALRPYRIVEPTSTARVHSARGAARLPGPFDVPAAAATPGPEVRVPVLHPAPPVAEARPDPAMPVKSWDHHEPIPAAPAPAEWSEPVEAMEDAPPSGPARSWDADSNPRPEEESILTTLGLWGFGGAVLGTGASWTLGGSTTLGASIGGVGGLTIAWIWLKWAARR